MPAWAAAQISTYTEGVPGIPFSVLSLDPALTAGDPGDQALALVTPITGALPVTVSAQSLPLDLGQPSVDKEFLSLAWTATVPRGTSMLISYSVNRGAWLPAIGRNTGGFDLPGATHGLTIAYRVTFISADSAATPSLDDIGIEYTRWTGKPTNPGGAGDGTSHKPHPGPTYAAASGTYRFPDASGAASAGGASAAGGGSSAGAGSGSGAGSSSGAGSGAGSATGTTVQTASGVPTPPVQSTVSGPLQTVTGVAVDGEQTITGTLMRPLSGGTGASTARLPGTGASHRDIPYAGIAVGVLLLAFILFTPWLVMAARLRRITGYDSRRARFYGPFGPLAGRAPRDVRDSW
ncbi:MAG TPA: hypothetical protein VFD50_10085 [Thermoleophilia bacterium]|nr:hypothetical protein [Thermoleophilia bacterium]